MFSKRFCFKSVKRIIAANRNVTLSNITTPAAILSTVVLNRAYSAYVNADAIMIYAKPDEELLVHTDAIEESTLVESTSDLTLFARAQMIIEELKQIVRYMQRLLAYLVYGIPVAVLIPAANSVSSLGIPELEDAIWEYVVWSIEQLGPTFIKFAQWASTRPDLYPPKLTKRLQKLQDDVPVRHTFAVVENTLNEAFGPGWREQLTLDPNPIGAGCIAQVFKGTLQQTAGEASIDVAVKLIHPHVEAIVKTDMAMLSFLASLMDYSPFLEVMSFGDTCRQFAQMMQDQLDMRKEALNLKIFCKKFKDDSHWALFPAPIDGFIHKNVLVETLMQGTPLREFLALDGTRDKQVDRLKRKLSDLGCRSALKMIFFDNFVHGDMHPGNILVQFTAEGDPRYVFLDCGLVFWSRSQEDHKCLVDICLAFMGHDGCKAAGLMMERSNERSGRLSEAADKKAFCDGVQKMIDDSETVAFYEHFGIYVNQICDLSRQFRVKLDPQYFHVAMALKVMEGISLALNRDTDMVARCIPVIMKAQALRKMGISKFPTHEDALRDLRPESSTDIATDAFSWSERMSRFVDSILGRRRE